MFKRLLNLFNKRLEHFIPGQRCLGSICHVNISTQRIFIRKVEGSMSLSCSAAEKRLCQNCGNYMANYPPERHYTVNCRCIVDGSFSYLGTSLHIQYRYCSTHPYVPSPLN